MRQYHHIGIPATESKPGEIHKKALLSDSGACLHAGLATDAR